MARENAFRDSASLKFSPWVLKRRTVVQSRETEAQSSSARISVSARGRGETKSASPAS